MKKKPILAEIPEDLVVALSELARSSGRKKNLLLAASLGTFIQTSREEQEIIIRKHLEVYREE